MVVAESWVCGVAADVSTGRDAALKENEARIETLASGRFELRRQLGSGGLGVVYEAYDYERARVVALKTLPRMDAHGIGRLKHEFRALSGVVHGNLVRLLELFADGDHWFFTMDLVDGVPFLEHVRRDARTRESEPPMPPSHSELALAQTVQTHPSGANGNASVVAQGDSGVVQQAAMPDRESGPPKATDVRVDALRDALWQLARGVSAVHAAGKLHCDLKPRNVLVDPRDGRLTILDFGLVMERGAHPEAQDGTALVSGTPGYMAPEQAAGEPLSEASDWYAVGVMLYEALTGQLPFRGHAAELLRAKQLIDPVPPERLVDGPLPQDLCVLAMALLTRDPLARPTGARVLSALRAPRDAHDQAETGVSAPPDAGLLGRSAELTFLVEALHASRNRAVTVYLDGPAGIGKSALMRAALEQLRREHGAVVLSGRCYERERLPFKAFDSIVDALTGYLVEQSDGVVAALLPRDVNSVARLFPVLKRVQRIRDAPNPTQPRADLHHLRARAFGAVKELLARIADRTPLVLHIDDAQWGDSDSAHLLREVLTTADAPAMLFVASYRTDDADASPLLRQLRARDPHTATALRPRPTPRSDVPPEAHIALGDGTGEVLELSLGPLPEHATAQLVANWQSQHGGSAADAKAIAREAGGNPFFAAQLVQHLAAVDADVERPRSLTLEEVLRARLVRLPEDARRLLETVAVAGHPLSHGALMIAKGEPPAGERARDDERALALLQAQMWLRSHDTGARVTFECYHDRIREIVVATLPEDAVRGAHARIAEALEEHDDCSPMELTGHYVAAGQPLRAAHHAERAAEQASEALAFDDAARLYRLALQLGRPVPVRRAQLEAQLGDALACSGRGQEAARSYLRAAGTEQPTRALELRRRAAEQLLMSGHFDEGVATLTRVLDTVGLHYPATPKRALTSLIRKRAVVRMRGLSFRRVAEARIDPRRIMQIDTAWTAAIGLSVVDPIRGASFQAEHLRLALATGEPYRAARALSLEAAFTAFPGARARGRAVALAQVATDLAHELGHAHALGLAMTTRGMVAYLTGCWAEAVQYCDAAERILLERCRGTLWELSSARRFALSSLVFMGQLKELRARGPALLGEARDRDNRFAETDLRMRLLTPCLLADDDPEQARREADDALDQWSQRGFHLQHYNHLYSLAQCALYRGDGPAALELLQGAWPELRRTMLLRIQGLRVEATHALGRAMLLSLSAPSAGDARPLRSAIDDLRREGTDWASGLSLLLRAGLAARQGRLIVAHQHLRMAVGLFDQSEMGMYAAAARMRLGGLIGADEGRLQADRGTRFMRAQGVRDPARFVTMLTPGFD